MSVVFFMWPVHLCLVRTYSDTVTCFCADHTLTALPKSPMETKSPRKTVAEGSVRCDVNQILWQQRAEICRAGWQHVGLLSCINSLMQDKYPCYRRQKGSASTSGLFWSLLKPVSGVIQITKYPPKKYSKTAFTALTTWQQFVCCAATRLHRTQGSKKQQRTWQLGASRHADVFEG